MKALWLDNRDFLGLFLCWLFVGVFFLANIETGDAIFYINAHRNDFWDVFFIYGTQITEETFYLLLIFSLLFIKIRYSVLLLFTGLIVLGISTALKSWFLHDRPFVYFSILGVMDQITPIEGVRLLVGKSSFPSGHTTSAFAMFSLLGYLFSRKIKLGWLFFSLALIVAISRMYLIQHFFKDVYAGSILGVLIGTLIYQIHLNISTEKKYWWNRSVQELFKSSAPRSTP